MRLTKTLYIVDEVQSDEIIGYDYRDLPIYGTETVYMPFKGELEPYSAKLAENQLGLFVDVTHRLFCYPISNLSIGTEIEYNNDNYVVTECLRYDKHYEVLIKKGGL